MKYFLPTVVMTLLALIAAGQSFDEVAGSAGLSGGYGSPTFFGGGGVSFADFNQDGWDDLTFCTGPGQQLQFYLNNGDSTFTLVDPPYIDHTGESTHAVWVDYDGDGDKDLFVATYNAPNRLYRNTGGLILVDATTEAGLPLLNEYSYGASFADIDLDGDLDLYVCNYGPPWTGQANYLYLNHGDGTFSDITTPLTGNGAQQTWCATFFDYNLDGWSDLYIVNDRHIWPNALLQGGPGGVFTDVSVSSGTNVSHLAMNGGGGDYNNDGFPDIYLTTNDTS
ncbi:MAG: VCBS repeat-containing protein, partial [Saprospiraceae bacterium]|nr:VCBS repeat-containing protein [Saprospiraceae bacterium]